MGYPEALSFGPGNVSLQNLTSCRRTGPLGWGLLDLEGLDLLRQPSKFSSQGGQWEVDEPGGQGVEEDWAPTDWQASLLGNSASLFVKCRHFCIRLFSSLRQNARQKQCAREAGFIFVHR